MNRGGYSSGTNASGSVTSKFKESAREETRGRPRGEWLTLRGTQSYYSQSLPWVPRVPQGRFRPRPRRLWNLNLIY